MHKITKEKVAIVLLVATVITNPLTGQYILTFIDWLFQQIFIYGAWVTLVAAIYATGLIFHYMYITREHVNVPKKSKKAPSKYIVT